MNKIFYFFIALAFGMIVFGCLTTGSIDWDIKADKMPPSYEVVE